MFSPLRIKKYHGKKIKLKDIDSRYLTCSTTPKKPTHQPKLHRDYLPQTAQLSWGLLAEHQRTDHTASRFLTAQPAVLAPCTGWELVCVLTAG